MFTVDCDEEMDALIAACKEVGKPGKLTITLEIKPDRHDSITIIPECTAKLPKFDPLSNPYYLTSDNVVSDTHPKQESLVFDDSVSPIKAKLDAIDV